MSGARHGRPGEAGFALTAALFAVATLLIVASCALIIGSGNVLTSRNYRGSVQVHLVAESAIAEALQIANGAGVVDFRYDAPVQQPTSVSTFAPLPNFRYVVTPVASTTDPVNRGRFVATATGLMGEKNVVVANVSRSSFPGTAPGVIYLAPDAATNATFQGNAFTVDGNDHRMTGGAGTAPPIPGIATRNDTNAQEAINSLSNQQRDNVTGLGYSNGPPIVPSISAYPAAPTVAQVNQFIADLLARPGVVNVPDDKINGNVTFGTIAAPQITHLTNPDVTIKANGNANGAGILIVDGDLTIQGSITFKGLILVHGRTTVGAESTLTGNATFYGSMWTNDLNLTVGGSAIAYYSSEAMALANTVGGGGALPAPLQVTSIADCSAVPSGVGGCP